MSEQNGANIQLIQSCRAEIEKTHQLIGILMKRIRDCNHHIMDMEEKLGQLCKHKWNRDYSVFDIESKALVCSICGMRV